MGPDGLEPSPTRLRAGCAATNTSIPMDYSFIIQATRHKSCVLSFLPATRVGFEPNLASVKDWRPHQKSNGPLWVRTFHAKRIRIARILVCDVYVRCKFVSATELSLGPGMQKARRLATPGPGGTRLCARCQVIQLGLPRRLPSRLEQSDCSGQQRQLRHSRHRHIYEANMISLSGMRLIATIVRSVSMRCCDTAKGSRARRDFFLRPQT